MAYGSYGKMKSFASEMQDFQNPHHDHAEEIATDVQTKVNKLEIIVQAMWEILQDQGVTVEQLHNKIDELVADPEKKVKHAYENIRKVNCPQCGKAIQEARNTPLRGRCLFCGAQVTFYPFMNAEEEAADQTQQSNEEEFF